MSAIANEVFDAALSYIKNNVNKVQVLKASSGVLVNKASGVSASDFGSPAEYGSGGRQITCLTGADFQGLSVSTGGSATKVRLLKTSAMVISADISGGAVTLGSSDQVNIGSFDVILKDPA